MPHLKIKKKIVFSVSIVKPTRLTSVSNLFHFGMTLHVSDGPSVHHQEFKTIYSSICLTNAFRCMYSLEFLMMDGKTVRNMLSVIPK